jgi:Fur family transcriptional regulator, zinc uptake regulator
MTTAPQSFTERDTDTRLARAETLCAVRGAALTPIRRDVLELLLAAPGPMGAYALLDQLQARRGRAAPPTVYRALAFLMKQGFVHRIERLNAYLPCATLSEPAGAGAAAYDAQFLICGRCGAATELHDPTLAGALMQSAERLGFDAREASVEVVGVCAACRSD